MNSLIERKLYFDKITPFIHKDVIKVLVGQRRVGKSSLLKMLMNHISKENKKAHIIYINKELHEFSQIMDNEDLYSYVKEQYKEKEKNYLFIDEIQEITGFEKALQNLQAEGLLDIYCTGSNAYMLSGELATLLSGRYVEFKIYGLSYSEFLQFHSLKTGDDSLYSYLKFGGLPYLIHLEFEDDVIYDYLVSIYNTIILKDVVRRYKVRNVDFLQRLIEYVGDNVGSIFSAKRVSDFLKSQRIKISPNVVLDYLSYLVSAFFLFKVKRTDIIGKKIFEIGEKYYFEDLGIRNVISGFKQTDINKLIENAIFNHLKICNYSVSVGKLENQEIDFVAEKKGERVYIQAAYLLSSEEVIEREFGNLKKIKDNYKKIVVSMDKGGAGSVEGIIHSNLIDFLLKDPLE